LINTKIAAPAIWALSMLALKSESEKTVNFEVPVLGFFSK
jgi:hypothetical protein